METLLFLLDSTIEPLSERPSILIGDGNNFMSALSINLAIVGTAVNPHRGWKLFLYATKQYF
jgi:hypothetical protein